MTTPPSAAALATELAHLLNLPTDQRGPAEGDRYDEVRWALADIDPADRMAAYAAAVAAVDPDHLAGPHPDPTSPLTPELYAFETWRVAHMCHNEDPRADMAERLLLVTDPLFHTFTPRQLFTHAEVSVQLTLGTLTADDFPNFTLEDHLRAHGADMEAWETAASAYADAAVAIRSESATDD